MENGQFLLRTTFQPTAVTFRPLSNSVQSYTIITKEKYWMMGKPSMRADSYAFSLSRGVCSRKTAKSFFLLQFVGLDICLAASDAIQRDLEISPALRFLASKRLGRRLAQFGRFLFRNRPGTSFHHFMINMGDIYDIVCGTSQ